MYAVIWCVMGTPLRPEEVPGAWAIMKRKVQWDDLVWKKQDRVEGSVSLLMADDGVPTRTGRWHVEVMQGALRYGCQEIPAGTSADLYVRARDTERRRRGYGRSRYSCSIITADRLPDTRSHAANSSDGDHRKGRAWLLTRHGESSRRYSCANTRAVPSPPLEGLSCVGRAQMRKGHPCNTCGGVHYCRGET